MSLQEEVDVLRRIPMFAQLDAPKLKLIAFTSDRANFRQGDVLFRQGDPGDAAFIVLDGAAEVYLDTPGGEIRLAEIGQHAIVGEMALIMGVPRTASVRASTPLATLKISKDLFFRLVQDIPQIAIEVMRELAMRLERTNTQLRTAVSNSNGRG